MNSGKSKCIVLVSSVIVCGSILAWIHVRRPSFIQQQQQQQQLQPKTETLSSQCPVDVILCGEKVYGKDAKITTRFDALRSTFYSLMTTIDFQCPSTKRFGREGDGGYEACMSKLISPNNTSCLVYSFGVSGDWSFDEDFAKYGCEVHSFDPSIGKEDHLHSPNVHFHNLGLWGNDYVNPAGWKLLRLSTIKKQLGHEKRLIDALKVDVEGAEWPFLRDILFSDSTVLSTVKQLYVELHTPKFRPQNVTAADFAEINLYVKRLRDEFGFLLYKNVQRNNCCGRFSDLMPPGVPERCCHEVFFFNSHLLGRWA